MPETWERASKMLGKDESAYWTRTNVNPYENKEGLGKAIDSLVKYGRPRAAIGCLYRMHREKMPMDNKQVVRVLLEAVNSPEPGVPLDVFDATGLIKALQDGATTDPDDLFKVEWAYLPLLSGHPGAAPKILEQRLADDHDFFCQLIRLISRSDKNETPPQERTEKERNVATAASGLLRNWRTVPGSRGGAFNGVALAEWLKKVKDTCTESGHLQSALSRFGHVLVYAPSDPDGLWIHRSVAELLNAKDADVMRNGFQNEFYYSRGAHWVDPTGKSERALAAKFRDKAQQVETAGYHRLATTFKNLAETYDREGERVAAEATEED
jgi:pentatricopeptide repeat protein